MSHFVYIILCEDNSLYTGYSTDYKRRFNQHLVGKGAKYTKSHRPKEIIYIKEFTDKSLALKYEYKIKQLSKKDKIELVNSLDNELYRKK